MAGKATTNPEAGANIAAASTPRPETATDLAALKQKAAALPLSAVAPTETTTVAVPDIEVVRLVEEFQTLFGISGANALIAFYLLFLKGAANAGAPSSMSVTVMDLQNEPAVITKADLMTSYRRITGNNFLRRLADTLAKDISQYAEANGLKGDLATRIGTRLLAAEKTPLSLKEQAWASSFCQALPGLEELSSERVPQLLAEDYNLRFSKPKTNKTGQTDNRKTDQASKQKPNFGNSSSPKGKPQPRG